MKNGDVKFKKTYLTGAEVSTLVREAVNIYRQGGLYEDYDYNPIDMEINFYVGLFYYVVDNFDIESEEQFEELFSSGVHEDILKEVKNAKLAYDLMWKLAKEISGSVNIISNKINNFIKNMPEMDEMQEVLKKLPEQWNSVKGEYDNIMNSKLSEEGDKE